MSHNNISHDIIMTENYKKIFDIPIVYGNNLELSLFITLLEKWHNEKWRKF